MNMQETALFYLHRYRRELEDKATFDHEQAAQRGMPYSERTRRLAETDKYREEYEAICWVCNQIASGKHE